ncbi:MAG: TonB-dependent receptor domain-containing protein [Gammaproteobacteria bacterium]
MQNNLFHTLMLAGVGASLSVQAANQGEAHDLPEMVVTATRSETLKTELATASTVFTREDIEQLQVRTLPELLNRSVGIDMTQNGGYGKVSSVFMRGTNSDHVLVLIDGIKVGSVTLGTTPFELIPVEQIERVEIIRGPHSSLYGSEAIGGVIQIFTRKGGQHAKPTISIDAGAGSFDTFKGSGAISGKYQDSWYSLSASHLNSQGFSARQNRDPDRDGYYNTSMNARVGHHFSNSAELEAFYLRSEGNNEFDGFQYKSEFTNQVVGIQGSMNFTEDWRSTLRLGQSKDDSYNVATNPRFNSRFNSTRWNVSWLHNVQLNENHQLSFGSDFRLDEVDSTTTYVKTSRYDVGVFGQLHSRLFDNHHLTASLRWDENQAFGDYVTGNFGWRYNWECDISAFASFGNAFKAPTLNDLYYADLGGSHGDPNLKPEESTSFEVGLSGKQDWANWEVRAYHTNIDNLITWFTDRNTFVSVPMQTDKAQIDGIEAEVSRDIFGWHNKLGFQFLRPIDRQNHLRLPRRADTILTYDLSRSYGAVDLGANVLARGNSFEQDWLGSRTQVPGFATVDLRAAYRIDKHWMLSAKLNNLLDKQYQTVDTYNMAGRNFFFSIHYNN